MHLFSLFMIVFYVNMSHLRDYKKLISLKYISVNMLFMYIYVSLHIQVLLCVNEPMSIGQVTHHKHTSVGVLLYYQSLF